MQTITASSTVYGVEDAVMKKSPKLLNFGHSVAAASSNGYPVKDAMTKKSPKSLNFGHSVTAASSNGYPVKDAVTQKSPKSLNFGHSLLHYTHLRECSKPNMVVHPRNIKVR